MKGRRGGPHLTRRQRRELEWLQRRERRQRWVWIERWLILAWVYGLIAYVLYRAIEATGVWDAWE